MFNSVLESFEFALIYYLAIYILSFLGFAWIVYIIVRAKRSGNNISKLSWIGVIIALFIIWQSVPQTFSILMMSSQNSQRENTYAKLSIATSVFPTQKGIYYIYLAICQKDLKKRIDYLNKAYSYIKSYKYPCWIIPAFVYYNNGDYDKVIEISKYTYPHEKKLNPVYQRPRYVLIAKCYIMKGDFKSAIMYIDKELASVKVNDNTYMTALALKSYLESRRGNRLLVTKYYYEAENIYKDLKSYDMETKSYKKLSDKESFRDYYNKRYTDFYTYEQNRLKELRAKSVE